MVKEFEFYHGLVFTKLVHGIGFPIILEVYPSEGNSSYILNKHTGLYIKHSAARMSPWSFSFKKEHQDEIAEMKKKLDQVFIVLVCNDDGIVCLNFEELKTVLNEEHGLVEWVRVDRKPREQYSVRGSDGKLRFKIAEKDFTRKIFERIKILDL